MAYQVANDTNACPGCASQGVDIMFANKNLLSVHFATELLKGTARHTEALFGLLWRGGEAATRRTYCMRGSGKKLGVGGLKFSGTSTPSLQLNDD